MKPLSRILFWAAIVICQAAAFKLNGQNPPTPPKYKVDGNFSDWANFETGWKETGVDWSKVREEPSFEGIDLKEFYYDNDDAYLYLFFKCVPTVQQRYEKQHAAGDLGYLYIDSDMNTNTGSTDRGHGFAGFVGSDFEIYLPLGVYHRFSPTNGEQSGCYVCYELKRWDPSSKSFGQEVRKEESVTASPLIAHGNDGVELALPLSDLGLKKGNKLSFVCWEGGAPQSRINKITIHLK